MATRFTTAQGSETDAINSVADLANFDTVFSYAAVTSDDPTLTVAQMVNGIVKVSGQTSAQDVTTPTAAAVVAAIPNCQVGSSFEFTLQNGNTSSGAVTVVAGSGVTLTGDTAVPIGQTQIYRGIVTNATTAAVRLVGLLNANQMVDLTA
jgi:hypothetical protein